ncbi:hypothetical protein GQ53DRAFT_755948 [Thozetella sp. PMI_491]|nr:hypothetical protein GQ53DRAFT_755948 [Thozetella sp. PMI_491]
MASSVGWSRPSAQHFSRRTYGNEPSRVADAPCQSAPECGHALLTLILANRQLPISRERIEGVGGTPIPRSHYSHS